MSDRKRLLSASTWSAGAARRLCNLLGSADACGGIYIAGSRDHLRRHEINDFEFSVWKGAARHR